MNEYTKTGSSLLHANEYFEVRKDIVETPHGEKEYTYVSKNSAVVIVPFVSLDEVLLIEHYRYLSDGPSLEFPAGGIDEFETPLQAAHRELSEETGYIAENLNFEGKFYSSRGFSNEIVYVFSAKTLSPSKTGTDPSEEITKVVRMRIEDVYKKALDMEINGSSSLIAALKVLKS